MVSNKTITITSLTDEPIVLNGPSNGILLSSNRYSSLTLINLAEELSVSKTALTSSNKSAADSQIN